MFMHTSMNMKEFMTFVIVAVVVINFAVSAECAQHGREIVSLSARFKDGSSSYGGTWGEESTGPLLVVTCPHVGWVKQDGRWLIGDARLYTKEYLRISVGDEQYVLCKPKRWQCEKLRKIGFVVEEGCWYFGKEPTLFRTRRFGAKQPDEKSAAEIFLRKVAKISDDAIQDDIHFDIDAYVGVWDFGKLLGLGSGDGKRYVSIRKDGSGCVFISDNGCYVPCGEIRWTAEMGGIRCMDHGENPYYANESTDAYYFWLDNATGRLVANRWGNWGEMTRVNGIGDPAVACHRMMRSRKYSGCWSGGEMFNAFTIAFDPDGTGFFSGGMSASPFKWIADSDGNIELKISLPYGDITNVVARYDYSTDSMSVTGCRRGRRNTKVKSPNPARDMTDSLDKMNEKAMADRNKRICEFESMHEKKSEKLTFCDIESMIAWLSGADAKSGETRTALVPTSITQLSDTIAYSAKEGLSASLGVGYFERGERPPEAEVSMLRWNGGMRPPRLPPSQIEYREGIDEMLLLCKDSGITDISNWARHKMTRWWFCCCDVVSVRGVPKEKGKVFTEALRPRLGARFPCKVAVTTIIRKYVPKEEARN